MAEGPPARLSVFHIGARNWNFGSFGLKAMEEKWISSRQLGSGPSGDFEIFEERAVNYG